MATAVAAATASAIRNSVGIRISSVSGSVDVVALAAIDCESSLALTIPGAGIATNETLAMMPMWFWNPLALKFRNKVEHGAREFRLSIESPPPEPEGTWGAPASGPPAIPLVDLDKIMSLSSVEL